MAVIPTINDKLIKLFSFIGKDGKVQNINTYYGQKWSEIKTDNEVLNSIFEQVDDGDGIVQAKELNLLNKIFLYVDNIKNKTANNEIIEQEELQEFVNQQKEGKINIDKISKMDFSNGTTNWSEGIERNIKTITLNSTMKGTAIEEELQQIGKEQGFSIEIIDNDENQWIEDSSIRRHDGKIYVSNHSEPNGMTVLPKGEFTSERGNINATGQGNIIEHGFGFDLKIKNNEKYYGTSYLEGGNVLNTISAEGTPAALVGESSIGMTLDVLGLENTTENVELVKNLIAEDLGLPLDKVTFIPQYEFHIDMVYRPLQNGRIAIPDYDEGIIQLTNLYNQKCRELEELEKDPMATVQAKEQIRETIGKISEKIKNLKNVAEKTQATREEANDYLKANGYELVKIPCFTTSKTDRTNFMNGVGGTSTKTGQTYYITNKSEFPELQNIVEQYFIQSGIDNVYFVSTTKDLTRNGGIDCLTQEY